MTLRVLHTESSCGWGGQELRILTEAQDMAARGHRIELVADPSSRIAQQAGGFGLPLTMLPIKGKSLAGFMAMRNFISQYRFDVINTHSSTDTWLTGLAAASLNNAPPLVRTRHISAPFKNNFLTRWIYNRACAAVVTTGESLRLDLIGTLGTPPFQVISIPTGVDTDKHCPADRMSRFALRSANGLPVDRFLIGIVATLRSWKGHADLLAALHALAPAGPAADWHLVIVGDGPQQSNLREKVAELGLQGRVSMVGHQNEPADWFRSLDLFCLPSYANEGVPQALMQAMACGLPCITTTAGAITEAIEDSVCGLVVAPRDIAAITSAVERLAGDPALRASLGDAARARAKARFGRARMTDRMLEVFQKVICGEPVATDLAA